MQFDNTNGVTTISRRSFQSDLLAVWLNAPLSSTTISFPIDKICSYIKTTAGAGLIPIKELMIGKEVGGFQHEFVLIRTARPTGEDFWMRLERMPEGDPLKILLRVSKANDTATLSIRMEPLLGVKKSVEKIRAIFNGQLSLRDLFHVLEALGEESKRYSLWRQNCYFFASVVAEHLCRLDQTALVSGDLRWLNLGQGIRRKIYERIIASYLATAVMDVKSDIASYIAAAMRDVDSDIASYVAASVSNVDLGILSIISNRDISNVVPGRLAPAAFPWRKKELMRITKMLRSYLHCDGLDDLSSMKELIVRNQLDLCLPKVIRIVKPTGGKFWIRLDWQRALPAKPLDTVAFSWRSEPSLLWNEKTSVSMNDLLYVVEALRETEYGPLPLAMMASAYLSNPNPAASMSAYSRRTPRSSRRIQKLIPSILRRSSEGSHEFEESNWI